MHTSLLTTNEHYQQYQKMKTSLQLPLKIKLYFTFLESALSEQTQPRHAPHVHGLSAMFHQAFCQLSRDEKVYYLYCNMQSIKRQYEKFETTAKQVRQECGSSIAASGQISETMMGLSYWSQVQLSFAYELRQIKLETKSRNITVDLRQYLARKSKKYKNTFILEAVSELVSAANRKITLFFKSSIFDKVYSQILKCIIQYRNEQLFKIAMDQMPSDSSLAEVSYIGNNSKSINFLSSKNVNEYLNFKDTLLKRLLRADCHFGSVYSDERCSIGVDKTQRNGKDLYKMEMKFSCPVAELKKNFMARYRAQSFKYMIQSQQLESFSNKYSAIYQKMLFRSVQTSFHTVEQIVLEEVNQKQLPSENEFLIFQRGISSEHLNSLVDFLMIKVKGMGTDHHSKLVVLGTFNPISTSSSTDQPSKINTRLDSEQSQQIIVMFLMELGEMTFRKEEGQENVRKILEQLRGASTSYSQIEWEGEFQTVEGREEGTEMVMDVDNLVEEEEVQGAPSSAAKNSDRLAGISTSYESAYSDRSTYLNHHFQMTPSPMTAQSDKKLTPNHFLFEEWYRKPKGGLVCKDSNAINEQKKVANYLLTTVGKRIFEQKGLFNISLPVTIFRPQSHLHSVARNLSFAPILLEKAATMTTIQRMKMVVLYALSVTASSISVSKPFNPILGETLQAWIDGCPVYLEQVSHHPPIVAYYMVGRGYKVYGSIGPKTSFGFNSLIGYSEEPNFVEFDDGTKFELNFGKMVISGLVFGERTFNFSDKMYVVDPVHRLFSTLKFADESSTFFTGSQPEDNIIGKIVQVSDQFLNQFKSHNKISYPEKEHIIAEISKFAGRWNSKVEFDDIPYIDFGNQKACEVEKEPYLLPSDSSFRKDIQHLSKGRISSSQAEKEKLEAIQRRDQNLRLQAGRTYDQ